MAKNIFIVWKMDESGDNLILQYNATIAGAEKDIHAICENYMQQHPVQDGERYEPAYTKGLADPDGHWTTLHLHKFTRGERHPKVVLHIFVRREQLRR